MSTDTTAAADLAAIDAADRHDANPAYVGGPTQAEVEEQVAAHRAAGIAVARSYLAKGMPGRAFYELVRSLERQARVAGISLSTGDVDSFDGVRRLTGGVR